MTKEYLEAFKNLKQELYYSPSQIPNIDKWHETIEEALQRLEQIDNIKPSEALKCLEYIGETCYVEAGDAEEDCILYAKNYIGYDTIKQALIKSQQQEKFVDIIKRKGLFISAKELIRIETYEDYKGIISERKLQQELFLHIIPTLIDWNNLDDTMYYTEEEFNIVKEAMKNE